MFRHLSVAMNLTATSGSSPAGREWPSSAQAKHATSMRNGRYVGCDRAYVPSGPSCTKAQHLGARSVNGIRGADQSARSAEPTCCVAKSPIGRLHIKPDWPDGFHQPAFAFHLPSWRRRVATSQTPMVCTAASRVAEA